MRSRARGISGYVRGIIREYQTRRRRQSCTSVVVASLQMPRMASPRGSTLDAAPLEQLFLFVEHPDGASSSKPQFIKSERIERDQAGRLLDRNAVRGKLFRMNCHPMLHGDSLGPLPLSKRWGKVQVARHQLQKL